MIILVRIEDVGSDVLLVTYTDGAKDASGTLLQHSVRGWVSATTHYYPPAAYDLLGNLLPAAIARAMSPLEIGTYARGLVSGTRPTPKLITFV